MGDGIEIVRATRRPGAGAEGQAILSKQSPGIAAPLLQIFGAQLPKGVEQPGPVGPGRPVPPKQFVKGAHLRAVGAVKHAGAGKIERVHASANASRLWPVTGRSSTPRGFPGIIFLTKDLCFPQRECTPWPLPAVIYSAAPPQA